MKQKGKQHEILARCTIDILYYLGTSICVCVRACVWQEVKASPRTVILRPLKRIHIHTHTRREEDAALSPFTQEVLFLSAISCLSHLDPQNTHADTHQHTHPPLYIKVNVFDVYRSALQESTYILQEPRCF